MTMVYMVSLSVSDDFFAQREYKSGENLSPAFLGGFYKDKTRAVDIAAGNTR
jgi:hypothetical protein